MNKIKKGSVVIKKSDKNKIIFIVEKIKVEQKKKIAILKGVYVRIIEKLPVEELELVDRKYVNKYIEENTKILENKIYKRRNSYNNIKTGKILHLDGDKRYMEKYLDITPGSVSVLGLMNDKENVVQLLIDEDVLKAPYFGCHPCINTSSLKFTTEDLEKKVISALHHDPVMVNLPVSEIKE